MSSDEIAGTLDTSLLVTCYIQITSNFNNHVHFFPEINMFNFLGIKCYKMLQKLNICASYSQLPST